MSLSVTNQITGMIIKGMQIDWKFRESLVHAYFIHCWLIGRIEPTPDVLGDFCSRTKCLFLVHKVAIPVNKSNMNHRSPNEVISF
jgi:hypothetical protein